MSVYFGQKLAENVVLYLVVMQIFCVCKLWRGGGGVLLACYVVP